MQGFVRHGNNMILPVLPGAHAARRRLMTPVLSLFWSLPRGPKGVITDPLKRYVLIHTGL